MALWVLALIFVFGFRYRERASGGPEAADFSDQLSLGSGGDLGCGRGALLAQACQDLPSIRSCYLTHCSPARASLLASQALYRGELQRVPALLLPVPKEPLLPTDWPFLPLIQLYHRASDTPSGLPPADTVGSLKARVPGSGSVPRTGLFVATSTATLHSVIPSPSWRSGLNPAAGPVSPWGSTGVARPHQPE